MIPIESPAATALSASNQGLHPQLRQHNISFTIPQAERVGVAKWLGEVKYFFANSGTEVSDPAMHFGATSHVYHQKATLNSVGGKMNIDAATGVTPVAPRERRPSALPNFNRRPSGVNLSSGAPNAAAATKPRVGAAASLLLVPGAAGTSAKSSSARNSVIGGNPKIFNPYAKYQPQPDDILEGITVHYVVQLIAIVGYYSEEIRVSAIRLLFRLSLVFDTKLEEHSRMLDEIILSIQTDDRGYSMAVHHLFHLIGASFSIMAVAIVAGLECFYLCPDSGVRSICISALSRIVFENEKIFMDEDQLAAIWNLYFAINFLPSTIAVFPDRCVVIQAIGLLTHLFTTDSGLTYRIMDSLLRLPDKTNDEIDAIENALSRIFEYINVEGSSPLSPSGFSSHKHLKGGYMLFLNMMNPHDEYTYDLLPWAIENYTVSLMNPSTTKPPPNSNDPLHSAAAAVESVSLSNSNAASSLRNAKKAMKKVLKDFPPLSEFILSLSNHFRATPALIRYGACVALHSALLVCPTLVQDFKQLYAFIVSGALDTDYLSAFLYTSMLDVVKSDAALIAGQTLVSSSSPPHTTPHGGALVESPHVNTGISVMVEQYRHKENETMTYDQLYIFDYQSGDDTQSITLSDILSDAVKNSPPLSSKLLHRVANSLEYMSKPMKMKQLELLKVWATKIDKFDTFLVQTLLPLLNSSDSDIQTATIRVLQGLMYSFKSAPVTDVNYAWGYISALLKIDRVKQGLLESLLNLLKLFPFDKISPESQKEFMKSLFCLIFHPESHIRNALYEVLSEFCILFKGNNDSLHYATLAILILSFGDQDYENQQKLCNVLTNLLAKSQFTDLGHFVSMLKEVPAVKLTSRIKVYDEFATFLSINRSHCKQIIETIVSEDISDYIWNFYLGDVSDNYLARPDEYTYKRNFIHTPFWFSTLYTKIGVLPPPTGDNAPRGVMPTTPANRRRFICGFLLCLLPSCGMPDPVIRSAACVSAIKCCIRQTIIHSGMLRGLLEYVSLQMLSNKYWTFQLSAIDIIRLIVRLKLSGVGHCMLRQYLDMALDAAYNSPSPPVKIGALKLIETFMLVFPNGIVGKLPEIRDIYRSLMIDKDPEVAEAAYRYYPIIFRGVTTMIAPEFFKYLTDELATFKKKGDQNNEQSLMQASDPLSNNLNNDEEIRIIKATILALGALNERSMAFNIINELLPFIKGSNSILRWAATTSILSQVSFISDNQANAILWSLIPLYFDPNPEIRKALVNFINRSSTCWDTLAISLSAHPDDTFVYPSDNWEELLVDNSVHNANPKCIEDVAVDFEDVYQQWEIDNNKHTIAEDEGLYVPSISNRTLQRVRQLSTSLTSQVQNQSINSVLFFLLELQQNSRLKAFSIITLSEFAFHHPDVLDVTLEVLISNLAQEVTPDFLPIVEATVLAIGNIVERIPTQAESIINKLNSSPMINEGEILALFHISQAVIDAGVETRNEMLKKYIPIISSPRYSTNKQLYSMYFCVELCLTTTTEDQTKVLDAIQLYLESADEPEQKRVHGCFSKILATYGAKHPMFRAMTGNAKKALRSKDPAVRMEALSSLQVFLKYLSPEEAMQFCFLYLADANDEIRNKAKNVMLMEGVLDFALPALRAIKYQPGTRRSDVMQSCKLPSVQKLGGVSVTPATSSEKKRVVPLENRDPFNYNYYQSEVAKKFLSRYGIPAPQQSRPPPEPSVLAALHEKAASIGGGAIKKQPAEDPVAKYQRIASFDSVTILHECIRKYPAVASDLIESLLRDLESRIETSSSTTTATNATANSNNSIGGGQPSDADPSGAATSSSVDTDIESAIHILSVFCNLLFSYDGIGDRTASFVNRLKKFVQSCNDIALNIRESLFLEMENSFYFFGGSVDIPIVSEDHYATSEAFKSNAQDATMEIVKAGRADKLSELDEKRNALNEVIDAKSERLRKTTTLSLHGVSGFGIFYALSSVCPDTHLSSAFKFLAEVLENEHRGIRRAAVEAMVLMVKIQSEEGGSSARRSQSLMYEVQTILTKFVERLSGDEKSNFYRRKVDIIRLIGELAPTLEDHSIREKIPQMLISMWTDSDNEVRATAIQMIQSLLSIGFDELTSVFDGEVMLEVSRLLGNAEYGEKEELQSLLEWRFNQPKLTR